MTPPTQAGGIFCFHGLTTADPLFIFIPYPELLAQKAARLD